MEVGNGRRAFRRFWLAAGLYLALGTPALADPLYNAIDLGTGNLTYGVGSSGDGTVTGSTGLSYTFNPVQNSLPAQWSGVTQGVPTVQPAPVGSPDTYGNPNYAYSYSSLSFMNSQGLAAGVNLYGVDGHMGNGEAFVTQQQANGSWGAPIPLWSGDSTFAGQGLHDVSILGISPGGQVLGTGEQNAYSGSAPQYLYLYDTTTKATTNLTSLVNSMPLPAQFPTGQSSNWLLTNNISQLDDQGRILVQATPGTLSGLPHNLLLVPEGLSSGPVATPEPSTWAVFATMIGGWMIRRRLGARPRS